jgi:sugar O-acyltransferase (sialic acid O-acetyltransferase NeuD family)
MADLVIFGTGHSAEVVRIYLGRYSTHRIVGFTVDAPYATADRFHDLPVVPWDRLEEFFPPDQVELLGPISYAGMNELRRDRYREGTARHYRFASFVHPDTHIHADHVGGHCFILEKTIVEPFVRIGDNAVIWGGCHIGHNTVIGDDCFLSGDVLLGARVRIGNRCFLAARAAVRGDVTIGDACLLGFGVTVQRDLVPGSVVVDGTQNRISRAPSSRVSRLL